MQDTVQDTLLDILVDPATGEELSLDEWEQDGAGEPKLVLRAGGRAYPVVGGIPRFVAIEDAGQRQTAASFGYKWKREATYGSKAMCEKSLQWMVERYGFGSVRALREFFASRERMLDAGCGSGFSSSLFLSADWGGREWVGLDISEAVEVARARLGGVPGTRFVQGDVSAPPFSKGTFDTILSEGVMHHTPSTERALKALAPLLRPGGAFLFYVYRRKAPVREFTDDYIRQVVSPLPPDEAWELIRPLTRLGEALAKLNVEVEVPEDVELLGIRAGTYDVQRLLYWHFAKMFWNDSYGFDEAQHINFDWYHPRYAHRHTEEELRGWCAEAGLAVRRVHAEESGYSVWAERG